MQRAAPPPPASTARTDSPQQAFVAPQAMPATASAPAAPASAGTGLVSNVLAWVGLAPLATNSPTAPMESPALWAVCAWCRRQNEKSPIGDTPTNSHTPTQNGQTIDGLVTGDLTAAGDQGDRQALADPSTTAIVGAGDRRRRQRRHAVDDDLCAGECGHTADPTIGPRPPRWGYHGTHREPHRSRQRRDRVGHGDPERHRLRQCRGGRGAVPGGRRAAACAEDTTPDTTSPYSVSWNTTTVANGTHTLTARARDAAGNTTTSVGERHRRPTPHRRPSRWGPARLMWLSPSAAAGPMSPTTTTTPSR